MREIELDKSIGISFTLGQERRCVSICSEGWVPQIFLKATASRDWQTLFTGETSELCSQRRQKQPYRQFLKNTVGSSEKRLAKAPSEEYRWVLQRYNYTRPGRTCPTSEERAGATSNLLLLSVKCRRLFGSPLESSERGLLAMWRLQVEKASCKATDMLLVAWRR